MGKKKGSSKNKIIVFVFLMILVVVGALITYYQYMKKQQKLTSEQRPTTEVEKLIAKDIENGYPETPTEVMKLWGRINQCMYNNSLNEEQIEALAKQLRLMYSTELLKQNEENEHITKLKKEVEQFTDNKNKIVNYTADTDTNVRYKTVNNQECAYIRLSCFITQATGGYVKSYQDFILGKEDGKWKVIGFQESKQEPSSKEEAMKDK